MPEDEQNGGKIDNEMYFRPLSELDFYHRYFSFRF